MNIDLASKYRRINLDTWHCCCTPGVLYLQQQHSTTIPSTAVVWYFVFIILFQRYNTSNFPNVRGPHTSPSFSTAAVFGVLFPHAGSRGGRRSSIKPECITNLRMFRSKLALDNRCRVGSANGGWLSWSVSSQHACRTSFDSTAVAVKCHATPPRLHPSKVQLAADDTSTTASLLRVGAPDDTLITRRMILYVNKYAEKSKSVSNITFKTAAAVHFVLLRKKKEGPTSRYPTTAVFVQQQHESKRGRPAVIIHR